MTMRLRKMIAQEISEARISSAMTICTGMVASAIRRMIDRS